MTRAYPYPQTGQYLLTFYQTATTTTLAVNLTASGTSVTLTAGAGFAAPGFLYFPVTRQIMRITAVVGNVVTVATRDGINGLGTGQVAETAGVTVVYARGPSYTSGARQMFQNNPTVGDFILISNGDNDAYNILESTYFQITTPSTLVGAQFTAWECMYTETMVTRSKWDPIVFFDGTALFTRTGTIGFQTIEGGYYNNSGQPKNFYCTIYNESGSSFGGAGYHLKIELAAIAGAGVGPSMDVGTTVRYEKAFIWNNELAMSYAGIYAEDLQTPLKVIEEGLKIRDAVTYDKKEVSLYAQISAFAVGGNLICNGIRTRPDQYMYFPFYEGVSRTARDLVTGNLWYTYGTAYPQDETSRVWTAGRFAGKSAFRFEGTRGMNDPSMAGTYSQCYGKVGTQFSVEAWIYPNTNNKGSIIHIGNSTLDAETVPIPFAFFFAGGNISFRVGFTDATSSDATFAMAAGAWYHVVGLYDGDNVQLWINGVNVATTPVTKTPNLAGATYFYIVDKDPSAVGWPQIDIDEIVIWNRALTPAEVAARFAASGGQYLEYVTETLVIAANAKYQFATPMAIVLGTSNTGTFDYDLFQTRLNLMARYEGMYQLFSAFVMRGTSALVDATNQTFIHGSIWHLGIRNTQLKSSGYYTLGTLTTFNGESLGINGGRLILYLSSGQGSYRNYMTGAKLYGTMLISSFPMVESGASTAFVDCEFVNVDTGIASISLYGSAGYNVSTGLKNARFRNIQVGAYFAHLIYDPTLLEITEEAVYRVHSVRTTGGVAIATDYHTSANTILYCSKAKLLDATTPLSIGVSTSFLVDVVCDSYTKALSTYYHSSIGYTLRLRILDLAGNPITGARVQIYDVNGKSALFRRITNAAGASLIYCTQTSLGGLNYGTILTQFDYDDGTNLAPGQVIRYDAEQMLVLTKPSANRITVTRGYNGYECVQHYNPTAQRRAWELQVPYLDTNASGLLPRVILVERQLRATATYTLFSPFTIRVSKAGYEPISFRFTPTERMTWTLTLQPTKRRFDSMEG